jgi:hypothetical protein
MLIIFVFYRVSQLYETGNFSYTLPTHRATVYLIGVAVRFVIRETKPSLSLNKVITDKLFYRKNITADAKKRRQYDKYDAETVIFVPLCSSNSGTIL